MKTKKKINIHTLIQTKSLKAKGHEIGGGKKKHKTKLCAKCKKHPTAKKYCTDCMLKLIKV